MKPFCASCACFLTIYKTRVLPSSGIFAWISPKLLRPSSKFVTLYSSLLSFPFPPQSKWLNDRIAPSIGSIHSMKRNCVTAVSKYLNIELNSPKFAVHEKTQWIKAPTNMTSAWIDSGSPKENMDGFMFITFWCLIISFNITMYSTSWSRLEMSVKPTSRAMKDVSPALHPKSMSDLSWYSLTTFWSSLRIISNLRCFFIGTTFPGSKMYSW